jgi:hypothetical protein
VALIRARIIDRSSHQSESSKYLCRTIEQLVLQQCLRIAMSCMLYFIGILTKEKGHREEKRSIPQSQTVGWPTAAAGRYIHSSSMELVWDSHLLPDRTAAFSLCTSSFSLTMRAVYSMNAGALHYLHTSSISKYFSSFNTISISFK